MNNENLDFDIFNGKFQTVQEHLEEMLLQVDGDFVSSELFAKALQELSTSLEELHVISEEMYEQREQVLIANQTIERERYHYQELFDLASDGYLETDVKGVIQEVNHTASTLLNVPREWLIGKPMAVFILQADRQNFYNLLTRLQQGEQVTSVELRLQPREKFFLYGAFKIVVVRNYENQIIGLRWLFQDISELRKSEVAQQQAENNLQIAEMENLRLIQVAKSASDGIFVTDPNQSDNPIVYVNPAFSRITGYESEEVIGRNIYFLQGIATDPQTVTKIRQALAEHREFKHITLGYRKDGEPFWSEFKISPVFSEAGDLLYFIGTQSDITERKISEQKIREQAALLDIANDAIIVQNLNNLVLFWNRGAERLYGWKAEEALGKNINKLLRQETLPQTSEIQQILNEQGFWEGELDQLTKMGQNIIVESHCTLVRYSEGNPTSILVVNSDITEKKTLQNHLSRAQRLESIGTLTSGIAHDMNNILTPILAIAQLFSFTIDPS